MKTILNIFKTNYKHSFILFIFIISFSDTYSQISDSFIKKVYPNSPNLVGNWIKGKTFVVMDNGEVVMFNEVDEVHYNQSDRIPFIYKTDEYINTQQANYLVGYTGISYQTFTIMDAIQLDGGGFAFCGQYLGPTATIINCLAAFIYTVDDQLNDVSFSYYPYSYSFNSLKQSQSGDLVVVGESLDEDYYDQYNTKVLKPSILLLEQNAPHYVLSAVILNDNSINYDDCEGAFNYVIKVAEEHTDGECFLAVGRIVAETQSYNPTRKSGLIAQFVVGGNAISVIDNQVYHSSGIGDEEVESDFISICQGGLNSYYIVSNISPHPYYALTFNSIGHIHLSGTQGSVMNISTLLAEYVVNSGYYDDNVFSKSITCSEDNDNDDVQLSTGYYLDSYQNSNGYILGTEGFFTGSTYYKKYDGAIVSGTSGNVVLNKILVDQNNRSLLAYGDFDDNTPDNSSFVIIGDNFDNLGNTDCGDEISFYPYYLSFVREGIDVIQINEEPYTPPRETFTCNPDEVLTCGTIPTKPVFAHPYYLASSMNSKRIWVQYDNKVILPDVLTDNDYDVLIFSIDGKLIHTIKSYSEMEGLRLPNGMYILRKGQDVRKIVVIN